MTYKKSHASDCGLVIHSSTCNYVLRIYNTNPSQISELRAVVTLSATWKVHLSYLQLRHCKRSLLSLSWSAAFIEQQIQLNSVSAVCTTRLYSASSPNSSTNTFITKEHCCSQFTHTSTCWTTRNALPSCSLCLAAWKKQKTVEREFAGLTSFATHLHICCVGAMYTLLLSIKVSSFQNYISLALKS